MPGFHFFLNKQDEDSLLTFIFEELRLSAIPDVDYETPVYTIISNLEAYRRDQWDKRSGGTLYLIGEGYFRCPLEMRQVGAGEVKRKKYYISAKNGGPAIDIHFRQVLEEDNERYLIPGHVSHYTTYWNTLLETNEKIPEELIKTYKEIVKFIKKNGYPCTPVTNWKFWAGKHAVAEFTEGHLKFRWGKKYYKPVVPKKRSRP